MRLSRPRFLVAAALLSAVLSPAREARSQTFALDVPSNPQNLCPLTPPTFAAWFQTGTVATDGFVTPANSTVSLAPNCDFYRWSERMFLWATSPAPHFYGGAAGARVFESPVFYGVTMADPTTGARALVPHPSSVPDVWFPAQAVNEVLRAQGGSLVYYSRVINDVFAYYRGLTTALPSFPTSAADLAAITALAASHGVTFSDGNALAVELKMSWVEASTLADPSSYITTHGTVPVYDTTNPSHWVQIGTHSVLLAMVGMHVAGSTLDHPEMVWGTFEHVANAPAETYQYVNTTGSTVTVPAATPTTAGWLFAAPGASSSFNVQRMTWNPLLGDITGTSGPIVPSNTIQVKPWGLSFGGGSAFANTQVISMDVNVHGMMASGAPGDLRNNYFQRGSTWTIPGSVPPAGQVGTSELANTTMETYLQGASPTSTAGMRTCLGCHTSISTSFTDTGVSHIFDGLPNVVPPAPAFPGSFLAGLDMATLHAFATGTTLGGGGPIVISGGGSVSTGFTSISEMFDPAQGTWSFTGPLLTPRAQHTATLLGDGNILIAGGMGQQGALASAEMFDAKKSAWMPTAPLAAARSGHTATLLGDGRTLVVGGASSKGALASVELFVPQKHVWTHVASLAMARSGHTATLLEDGRVLVVGGVGPKGELASAEIFDPGTNAWTPAGALGGARAQHTATLLDNGQVLIAGGVGPKGFVASASLYDPAQNTWIPVGWLAEARALATATHLDNGQILVTGGLGAQGALASAELFNPTTNDWFAASSLSAARYGHTATLLPGGDVLLAGGMDDLGPLASTETFSEIPDDQSCNDTPGCESCSDGIQNQGEQAVDCGGPCMPCACQCTGAVDANGEPLGPVACGDAVCSLDNAELMCVDFEELKEVGSCQ